jgi:Na+/proline symporter
VFAGTRLNITLYWYVRCLSYSVDYVLFPFATELLPPGVFAALHISSFAGGSTLLGMTQLASTFGLTYVKHWSLPA